MISVKQTKYRACKLSSALHFTALSETFRIHLSICIIKDLYHQSMAHNMVAGTLPERVWLDRCDLDDICEAQGEESVRLRLLAAICVASVPLALAELTVFQGDYD